MDQVIKLASKTLTDTFEVLYNKPSKPFIIKTVLLYNANTEAGYAVLNLDGMDFKFPVTADETKIINIPIVSNVIQAKGNKINIHISGIQIGE